MSGQIAVDVIDFKPKYYALMIPNLHPETHYVLQIVSVGLHGNSSVSNINATTLPKGMFNILIILLTA